MRKLLFFAFAIMTVAATAQTKSDPRGLNRYVIELDSKGKPFKASLAIFQELKLKKYDEKDATFFDGYTSGTAEELGLVGQPFWNESGSTATKCTMAKGAIIRYLTGSQITCGYLEGCRVGKNRDTFYNRIIFTNLEEVEVAPDKTTEPDKVIKTDGATTINIYNQGGAGGAGGNATVNPSTTTPTVTPFGPPVMPGQQFISLPNWQQQGIFMPQQGFIPQQQQMVWCNQQNNGFYWLEGARLVLGTAVDFARVFANRQPQVVNVDNENTIYNHITINQTVSNTPKTYPPVNNTPISQAPICENTGRPAVWHKYASGGGQWKCPGYDTPGTTNPGNGTVVTTGPGTNEPGGDNSGQTPPIIKNPGTNDPSGRYGKKITYQKVNNTPAAQYNVQPAKTYAPVNNVSYAPTKAYSNNVSKPAYAYKGNQYQRKN